MPVVILLHGRRTKSKREPHLKESENTHPGLSQAAQDQLPFTGPNATRNEKHIYFSSDSGRSNSIHPCNCHRSTRCGNRNAPEYFGLNESISSTTSSSSNPSGIESDSADEELNISTSKVHTNLREKKYSIGSTSKVNAPFQDHPSCRALNTNIAGNESRLCSWKIDQSLLKVSAKLRTESNSNQHIQWPDELVLNPETLEIWFNGHKYQNLKFKLRKRTSLGVDGYQNGCFGTFHVTLPFSVSHEVKLVCLMAHFVCSFNIWTHLLKRHFTRKELMNLKCMLGLKIGEWKLHIEFGPR